MRIAPPLAARIRKATLAELDRVGRDRFYRVVIVKRFAGKVNRATCYRHIARVVADQERNAASTAAPLSDLVEVLSRLVNGGLCPDEIQAEADSCAETDPDNARMLTAAASSQRQSLVIARDLLARIAG
jgi:hypothetical protein